MRRRRVALSIWNGAIVASGPLLPLTCTADAAAQLLKSGRTWIALRFRSDNVRYLRILTLAVGN